ncbi:unnamed protein product [Ilex paraguariensis]|uniref:F-box associated beta-propeller type 1 domain-containing protein n=1 Tax=Ilex paraguariensis TaxID=185542 RepID=A0ABC8TBJ5_9AQUA
MGTGGEDLWKDNNQACRLVHHYDFDTETYVVALFPDKTLKGMPSIHEEIDYLHIPPAMETGIGSIDGLFFLHNGLDDNMVLWNPTTREFRLLPAPHSILPPYFSTIWHTLGFGLDTLANIYKFIWIRSFWMSKWITLTLVAIYTLGSDSWRYLDPLELPNRTMHSSLCATYVNGEVFRLLGFWKNEDLLLESGCSELVLYNHDTKERKLRVLESMEISQIVDFRFLVTRRA